MLAWVVLVAAIIGFYYFVIRDSDTEEEELEPMVFQTFTPHSLAKHNGIDSPRVLVSVKGKVFDVTAAKNYYGPGGMYENFAGRDASRGLAKHSFEKEHLTDLNDPVDDLTSLTTEERQQLDQWAEFFGGKYPHVGDLVEASR